MEKAYKNCQSCSMPLTKDSKGGGTNADGTRSKMYCSLCFENGKFVHPNMTVIEMQSLVKNKLKEMGGVFKFFAGAFTRNIPKLERWKNKS